MLNLSNIFKNDKLANLYLDYKLVYFNAFKNWIEKDSLTDKNLIALSMLIKSLTKDLDCSMLNTFFYSTLVMILKEPQDKENYFILLLFALDSLFEYLPNEISINIAPTFASTFYLPKLSINVSLNNSISLIIKKNDRLFLSGHSIQDEYQIHDASSKINSYSIINFANENFLYQRIIAKFTQYDPLEERFFINYKNKLTSAIKSILLFDKGFESNLDRAEFVIPLAFIANDRTKSFTLSGLPHVIFLSDANSAVKIAENLIHESLHDELNIFMNFYDLFYDKNIVYYSPWRDDPRPIRGLLHAIYVFTGIYQYYYLLLKEKSGILEKNYIIYRYNLIHYELEMAYHQLSTAPGELTKLGDTFIKELYAVYCKSQSEHINIAYKEKVQEHAMSWKEMNPHVAISFPELTPS